MWVGHVDVVWTQLRWTWDLGFPVSVQFNGWWCSKGEWSIPVPEKFLGIVGQDLNDSKYDRLHVDIFWFAFHSFEVYSIISLKWSVILLKSPTSPGYFSNSTGSSPTNRPFSLDIDPCIILIWANQPIHSFLVGCLNPFVQGMRLQVFLP